MPAKKPHRLKVLDGDRPSRVADAPSPAIEGLGPPPEYLDVAEAEAWNRVAAEAPAGLLSRSDRLVVEIYARSYVLLSRCRDEIRDDGMILTTLTERGEVRKAHPLLPTSNQLAKQLVAILASLGMTPAGRASMALASKPEDPLVAFVASRPDDGPPPPMPEKAPGRPGKAPRGPA